MIECRPMIPAKSTISSVVADDKASSTSSPRSSAISMVSLGLGLGLAGGLYRFPRRVPDTWGTTSGISGVFRA